MLNEIKEEQEEHDIDPEKLVCTKSDAKFFNFGNGKITLEEAKKDQYKMLKQLEHLGEYDKKNLHKINSKKETLINAKKLCNNR